MKLTPTLPCRRIESFNLDDWAAVSRAFDGASFVPFQQGWIGQPTPGFRPAKASAAWTNDSLIVHAELNDDDIFNTMPVSDFNALAIHQGDVFEIFLQPAGQEAYHEIHITPNNHQVQLRIPFPGAFQKLKSRFASTDALIETFKVWSPMVESRVAIDTVSKVWRAVVKIPFSMLTGIRPVAGEMWRFSFSRYDYTRPDPEPTYSSTSPHSAINFHLVHEYGALTFSDGWPTKFFG